MEHQPALIENDRFDNSAASVTSFGGVRCLIAVGIIRSVLYRGRSAVLFVNMVGEQILVLVRNLLGQAPVWSEALLPAKSFRVTSSARDNDGFRPVGHRSLACRL